MRTPGKHELCAILGHADRQHSENSGELADDFRHTSRMLEFLRGRQVCAQRTPRWRRDSADASRYEMAECRRAYISA